MRKSLVSFLFYLLFPAFLTGLIVSVTAGQSSPFIDFVTERLARQETALDGVCPIKNDPIARRVFFEYGAVFVAEKDVRIPTACIFKTSAEVDKFQSRLDTETHSFAGVEIELQEAAMEKLTEAKEEAAKIRLKITPLDGSIAGKRTYDDTVRIWNSRFFRALDHWVKRGKISSSEAESARFAAVSDQVERVLEWESKGFYFSTGFSKSIFYSVAPPGTSQHLSMLAFDVVEARNPSVRNILNKHGWFQTIRTDQPHFTFLGLSEDELPRRGLRNIYHQGNSYWVPVAVD